MTILTNDEPITTRKLKGRTRRAVTLSTKITPRELELISAASEADGRALGEWVREAILKAAHSSSTGVGADHLMTEIVALQLFLTDVLSPVACACRARGHCTVRREERGRTPCLKQTGEEKRPSSGRHTARFIRSARSFLP